MNRGYSRDRHSATKLQGGNLLRSDTAPQAHEGIVPARSLPIHSLPLFKKWSVAPEGPKNQSKLPDLERCVKFFVAYHLLRWEITFFTGVLSVLY